MSIANIKTINQKDDRWEVAESNLSKDHPMTSIQHLESVDDIISSTLHCKHFAIETINTSSYTQRNLLLFNKNMEIIRVLHDVELIDNKMYMRKSFVPRRSWFAYLCSWVVPHQPNVHVNIRR